MRSRRLAVFLVGVAVTVLPALASRADEKPGHDPHADHGAHDSHAGHASHGDLPGTAPLASESVYQLEGRWKRAPEGEIALAELRGKPVVMLLFYGTCQAVCPILVRDVQRIEEGLSPAERERVRFVLVSFDPQVDTPAALAAYAKKQGLSADRFILLHGDPGQVRELAAVLGVRYRPVAEGQYSHTQRISVLDRDGKVAAHFDGLERPVSGMVDRVREEIGNTGAAAKTGS
ncbi:SCO1 protein [Myxococcaceae bacterium]|jgi:protein SCO1/2|nr:SCO1 protein [Myxococcaceae bacterium]